MVESSSDEDKPPKKRKMFHVLHQSNMQKTFQPNIPTSNRFTPLATIDPMDVDTHPTSSANTHTSRPQLPKSQSRVPPITIANHTKAQVIELCTTAKITGYHVKHISNGMNLYCKTSGDFVLMRDALKASDKLFYTHDIAADKEYKVVLKGLLDADEADLKDELAKHQIAPKSIRQIVPRNQKFPGQVLYVLSYPYNTMKMSTLRERQHLCMVSVEWDHYVTKKIGPTRCHRCQRYGHGSRNCGMTTRCAVCAEAHSIEDCPMVDDEGRLKEACAPKCANCSAAHVATFTECPKFIEYQQIQKTLNQKNVSRNRPRQQAQSGTSAAQHNQSLPRSRPNYEQIRQHTPVTGQMSYSAAVAGNSSWSQNPNLLPNDTLIQVTLELIPMLRNCRTVEDQLRAVLTIASKFAYHENGSK